MSDIIIIMTIIFIVIYLGLFLLLNWREVLDWRNW